MKKILLLTLLAACSHDVRDRVPPEWVRHESRTFSMMVPPGLVESALMAENGVSVSLTGPGILYEIREAKRRGETLGPAPFAQGFKVSKLPVCNGGRLETWMREDNQASAGLRHAAALICEDMEVAVYGRTEAERRAGLDSLKSVRRERRDD